MTMFLKATGVAFVLAAGLGSAVSVSVAADMPEYPPIIEAPEPLPLPAAGGWYLRGDIGYKFYNAPAARFSNPDYGSFLGGNPTAFTNESMDDSFNVGVGVGYKIDGFRTDLTLDYETPGEFYGRAFCAAACGAVGYSEETADITAWSLLLNGYFDIGEYYGITPYVGAGVGASYLVAHGLRSDGAPQVPDGEQWNFAWALMAGASYAVTDNISLDLGYRYLNLGDARSGNITDGLGETGHIVYEDIDAHEVRLGLRYYLN